MPETPDLDPAYADDLRRLVRRWRLEEWRRTKRSERGPEPRDTDLVIDDLVRCAWVLVRAYGGAHHVPPRPRVLPRSMEVTHYAHAATTDGDLLTRLVVLAHDAGVRIEATGSAPRYMRIALHPRTRATCCMTGHPTLEDHAAAVRASGAACPVAVPQG